MDALGVPAGPERLEVLQSMGAMRVALGDLDRAVANLEVAAGLHRAEDDWRPTGVQRANALRLAALANIEGGDLDAAERRLTSALEVLEGESDTPEISSVLYLFSQLRWHQSRHDEAFALAEKCLQEAERLDNTQAIAKGYEMLALACHSLGEWKRGTEFEERRHALADGALDVASAFDVHL
jgi:tetratricopeptide (TPR) repeat protein